MAEPIRGERLFALDRPDDPGQNATAISAVLCAKSGRPFEHEGRRWLITKLEVDGDRLSVEGRPWR
jgi:hypothetical protein